MMILRQSSREENLIRAMTNFQLGKTGFRLERGNNVVDHNICRYTEGALDRCNHFCLETSSPNLPLRTSGLEEIHSLA